MSDLQYRDQVLSTLYTLGKRISFPINLLSLMGIAFEEQLAEGRRRREKVDCTDEKRYPFDLYMNCILKVESRLSVPRV